MGNRWTQTRTSYHPCITSEATNEVCQVFWIDKQVYPKRVLRHLHLSLHYPHLQCHYYVKSVKRWRFFWSVFYLFSPNTGKYGTETTPYLDTFFTKLVSLFQFALIIIYDFCAISYHLYNSKNVKSIHGGVLKTCNFTRSSTSPWMFFTFFKFYKWFQIAQHITIDSSSFWPIDTSFKHSQFLILLSFSLLLWTVFFPTLWPSCAYRYVVTRLFFHWYCNKTIVSELSLLSPISFDWSLAVSFASNQSDCFGSNQSSHRVVSIPSSRRNISSFWQGPHGPRKILFFQESSQQFSPIDLGIT